MSVLAIKTPHEEKTIIATSKTNLGASSKKMHDKTTMHSEIRTKTALKISPFFLSLVI